MTNIPLALRLIACGLTVPETRPHYAGGVWGLETGHVIPGATCEWQRLLFVCVATDDGPRLLPVLDDFALLGWVTTKLRALYGPHSGVVPNPNEPPIAVWGVYDDDGNLICDAPTELEALTAAWEAALKAAE